MSELEVYKASQERIFGEFLHEIKTPLAILRSHLESEITNDALPLETRKKLVLDVEEIARMNTLINDVKFLFSESENPKSGTFYDANLLELVMDVIETLEPIAQAKDITISLISAKAFVLHVDKNRLKQLFYNLISNAIKYSHTKSSVVVTIEQIHEMVVVSISDSGIGIDTNDQERIFDAFYRVKGVGAEGTGLGLAICSAIAKMHGASIALESALHVGSKFRVIFERNSCES